MLYRSKNNGIFVDVTKAPYFADNTGKVDCTDALIAALDDILRREVEAVQAIRTKLLEDPRTAKGETFRIGFENRIEAGGIPTVIFPEDPPIARILYFPKGTYLVSDTICYTLEDLHNLINDRPGSDLNRFIHFQGEDMATTIIKLQDNCRAFRMGEHKAVVSFVRQRSSNVNMLNTFEDLTIDIGVGNTGAVGLRYDNSNTGKVRNVTIKSSDPAYRGDVAFEVPARSQSYVQNLFIDGFDIGISCKGGTTAFEDVKMTNVQKTAVNVSQGNVAICDADIEMCGGCGVYAGTDAMITLLNVNLKHTAKRRGTCAVRNYNGYIYIRNLATDGFWETVTNRYETVFSGGDGKVKEYITTDRPYTLFGAQQMSVGLPIEKQPVYEWNGDESIVAEVDSFGAKGDGVTDCTAAIQAAMNSGKEYIVFGEGRYLVSDEILIPASVKAINFMYCDFAITPDFAEEKEKGMLVIDEDSNEPLFMDDGFVFEKFYGYLRFIRHSAKRDLCVADLHVQTGAVYFNTVGGNKILMNNVASTMGVFGGIGYGSVPCFRFSDGEKVWIRQFNPERSADNVIVERDCDFWVFGFKTEGPDGKAYNIRDNSRAEIFCGNASIARDDGCPCIENKESSVFAFFRTDGCGPNHQFLVAVNEFQKGRRRVLFSYDMPKYGPEYYYIPGYVGIHNND